jgi:uncharacterized membrane protein YkvA (DUF1232 family)
MSLRVSFEISDRDIRHFRDIMRRARGTVRDADDEDILDAARAVFKDVKGARAPTFVTDRLSRLEAMASMVEDEDWKLPKAERNRILSALVYFCDPEDLIPDSIPGIGYLDDAIMVELALRELRHEIEGYDDFRQYRDKYDKGFRLRNDPDKREAKLTARREQLRERIARRRSKDEEAAADTARLL